jgi:hypothetical protein
MASFPSITCNIHNNLVEKGNRQTLSATLLNQNKDVREFTIEPGQIKTIEMVATQTLMITNKTYPMSGGIRISSKELQNSTIVVSDNQGVNGIFGGNPRQLYYSLIEMNNK